MNADLARSSYLCAVCYRVQKLRSLGHYCTGRPCYHRYRKHLEIQQGVGSDEAQQLGGWGVRAFVPPRPAKGASATEPGASASVPRPPRPPFQQGGGDVGAQQLRGGDVGAQQLGGWGVGAFVPPPPATEEMAEVVGLLKTVLTELTISKEEIKQFASDIQQLKDQVRVLTVAANDMVQR